MANLTLRFEGRMGEEMYQALDEYSKISGESKGEAFRKAMSLYLRVKRDKDSEVIIRNKIDKSKIVELAGL